MMIEYTFPISLKPNEVNLGVTDTETPIRRATTPSPWEEQLC